MRSFAERDEEKVLCNVMVQPDAEYRRAACYDCTLASPGQNRAYADACGVPTHGVIFPRARPQA